MCCLFCFEGNSLDHENDYRRKGKKQDLFHSDLTDFRFYSFKILILKIKLIKINLNKYIMNRLITTTLACLAIVMATTTVAAQEVKKTETKMDVFSSKTGVITKYIDTNLPKLASIYSTAETKIRAVQLGTTKAYFYQIVKEGKYGNTTASIAYTDLVEIIKALKVLKADVASDIASGSDYLENKFISDDGFQIGYYVSGGKASWYVKLDKYGRDNTLFIKDGDGMESALIAAKTKIDALKN